MRRGLKRKTYRRIEHAGDQSRDIRKKVHTYHEKPTVETRLHVVPTINEEKGKQKVECDKLDTAHNKNDIHSSGSCESNSGAQRVSIIVQADFNNK